MLCKTLLIQSCLTEHHYQSHYLFPKYYLIRESLLASCSAFQGFYFNCVLRSRVSANWLPSPKPLKIKQPWGMSIRDAIGPSNSPSMIYENNSLQNLGLGTSPLHCCSDCSNWSLIKPGHPTHSLPSHITVYRALQLPHSFMRSWVEPAGNLSSARWHTASLLFQKLLDFSRFQDTIPQPLTRGEGGFQTKIKWKYSFQNLWM